MNQTIKAGFISYLNAYPYYFPFEKGYFSFNGESILDYPENLNKKLFQGELDISLVSSMEYARNFKNYVLVNGLGLSSRGCVNSVKLFSNFSLENLSNKTIALTSASATSRAVLKVILSEMKCKSIKYIDFLDYESHHFDAYLVIGDEALKKNDTSFLFQYDLAKVWYDLYAMDILFAVVAIRRDSLSMKSKELIYFSKLLYEMPEFSLQHHDFYRCCYERFDLSISIEDYFSKLDFKPDNKQEQKDFLFRKFYDYNLIPEEVVEDED